MFFFCFLRFSVDDLFSNVGVLVLIVLLGLLAHGLVPLLSPNPNPNLNPKNPNPNPNPNPNSDPNSNPKP